MTEHIYTEYPELYDAIQSEWDYDRDVSFVMDKLTQHGIDGRSLLEIGCGTGEHTKRFMAEGFDVTAIDKYNGMLTTARTKCDANFYRMALPDITIDDNFDVVVAIRGVINHLSRDELTPSLKTIKSRLMDGGIFIFDNSPLPPNGNHPALDIGTTEHGAYGRIAQHVPIENGYLEWREIIFPPDGNFFVNSRQMTPYSDDTIATELANLGFTVQTDDGYGPDDDRTVFVAIV